MKAWRIVLTAVSIFVGCAALVASLRIATAQVETPGWFWPVIAVALVVSIAGVLFSYLSADRQSRSQRIVRQDWPEPDSSSKSVL